MTLSSIERTWFASRVAGQSGTTPLNDLKRRYYMSQLSGANVRFLEDLERQWLNKTIRTNGGTPTGNELSELWTQLVASVAGLRVSKFIGENKTTYFLNT